MFADDSINLSTINRMGNMVDGWISMQRKQCQKSSSCKNRCGKPCNAEMNKCAVKCHCDNLCMTHGGCCVDYWYHCRR